MPIKRLQSKHGKSTESAVNCWLSMRRMPAAASPQKEYGYRNGQLLIAAEAPGTTGGTTENVSWTNAVGVSASGNSLTKTSAGTAWSNAGAASVQSIVSGDGYVEFTATETNTDRICGLSQMEGSISLQGAPALPFTGSRNS